MSNQPSEGIVVATVDAFERERGHLYFISKQGHLSKIKRNTGHIIGAENPKKIVRKLGIKKRKGYLYYLKGNQVIEKPMKNVHNI